MHIPKHWGRAEREVQGRKGRLFLLTKWHWSDESVADAEAKAQERVAVMASRVIAGEPLPSQYGYGGDQPLREEVIEEVPGTNGHSLVTRNAYGALVLNSDNVMFVDIDFEPGEMPGSGNTRRGTATGSDFPSLEGQPADIAKSLLKWGMKRLLGGGQDHGAPQSRPPSGSTTGPAPDPAEQRVLDRVEEWTTRNPGWGFRAYRTNLGIRLIATNGTHDPESAETVRVMQELGADSLYQRLCRTQKSFRARLTPKPWRVGMNAPRPRFPYVNPGDTREMEGWLKKYEQKSASQATARFIRPVGNSAPPPPEIETVIQYHDHATRATQARLGLA